MNIFKLIEFLLITMHVFKMGDEAGGYTDAGDTDTGDTDTGDTDAGDTDTGDTDAGDTDAGDTDDGTILTGDKDDTGDTDNEGSDEVPETYADFDLPDGLVIADDVLTEATAVFKKLELTQEQAQELIDIQAKREQASQKEQTDSFDQLMKDWVADAKSDKEIGGDKFDENVKVARAAITKFGTPELKVLLESHGVGNHPEMIRFMSRVGRTLKEDIPGDEGGSDTGATDAISLLYPTETQT